MFDRVGTEGVLELVRGKGEVIDVIDHDEVRDLGVFYDVHVDAAAVGLAAADIQVPDSTAAADDSPENAVTEEIEDREQGDEEGGDGEDGEAHGRRETVF
jgi:hypothetical protein